MGRVGDAMRRASGEAAADQPEAAPGATALAGEPFPEERSAPQTPTAPPADPAGETLMTAAEASPEIQQHFGADLAAKVVVDATMMPASREQYRRLAATLHHAQEARGLKVVMVASAVAGEGKSLTASNLALTLSESYRRRVLLIDGDLRRSALADIFGVEAESGLSEALDAPDRIPMPVYDVSPRLTLLPAGQPNPDPMAALTSVRMRALIDEARTQFDWIIIDTPPVGLLPDANLLASMVDGTLFVIKAGSTPSALVQRAVAAIGAERVLGAVLNRAVPHAGSAYGYGYGYGYYDYRYGPSA